MYNTHQGLNTETRYNHEECGDNRGRLYVKRIKKGWIWHCFNCGRSGLQYNKDKGRTLDETKELIRQQRNIVDSHTDDAGIHLPSSYTTEIPTEAKCWLAKYGLTEKDLRCGYAYKRLILPLYNKEGELIFWQGRNLGKVTKDNPKYVNVRSKKTDYAIFKGTSNAKVVVLVEDILSAIKVSNTQCVDSVPILGSYIPTSILPFIKDYDTIFIWLDYDKRFTSIKAASTLHELSCKVCRTIITEKDPKEYTIEEIKEILNV